MSSALERYMERPIQLLDRLHVSPREDMAAQIGTLLDRIKDVDTPRVVSIAQVMQWEGAMNAVMRENIGNVKYGERYRDVEELFASIREDAKRAVAQYEDGKIDTREKFENFLRNLRLGSTHLRFNRITELYIDVEQDAREQLEAEGNIQDAYEDFRGAKLEAQIMSGEVLKAQEARWSAAKAAYLGADAALAAYAGEEVAEKGRLQLAKVEAERASRLEEAKYDLIKSVSEQMAEGAALSEGLIRQLRAVHEPKRKLHDHYVIFFQTHETAITLLDAIYNSNKGLDEIIRMSQASKKGIEDAISDVAQQSGTLARKATEEAYGPGIAVQRLVELVTAIEEQQAEVERIKEEKRKLSAENARDADLLINGSEEQKKAIVDKYSAATAALAK